MQQETGQPKPPHAVCGTGDARPVSGPIARRVWLG